MVPVKGVTPLHDPSDTVPDLPRADNSRTTMDVLDSELLPNETSGKRIRPDATVKGLGPSEAPVVYTIKPQRVSLAEKVRRAEEPEEEHFSWLEKDRSFVTTISASLVGLVACVLLIMFSGSAADETKTKAEPSARTPEAVSVSAEPPKMAEPPAPKAEPVAKAAPFPEAEEAAPAVKPVAKKKARARAATRVGARAKASTPKRRVRNRAGATLAR